jgi:hypothetical protein
LFPPLLFSRALLSSLATSRPPPVQATALLRGTGLKFDILLSDGRRRHLLSRSLLPRGRLARLPSDPLCILCLGPDLRIPVQICLPPNSLEARSRSLAFSSHPGAGIIFIAFSFRTQHSIHSGTFITNDVQLFLMSNIQNDNLYHIIHSHRMTSPQKMQGIVC